MTKPLSWFTERIGKTVTRNKLETKEREEVYVEDFYHAKYLSLLDVYFSEDGLLYNYKDERI